MPHSKGYIQYSHAQDAVTMSGYQWHPDPAYEQRVIFSSVDPPQQVLNSINMPTEWTSQ